MEGPIGGKQTFLGNIQLLFFTPHTCRQPLQYWAHVLFERDKSFPFENILVSGSAVHESDFYQEKQGTQESF